jgi:hypothetical protein
MSSANAGAGPALTIFDLSPYHYIPTEYVAIIFVVLFGLSTSIHLFQTVRYRMWWLLPTVCLCGFLEVLGWSARLWSSISPFLVTPFQIQITCTIIAPTPFIAANFIILGKIIHQLGTSYSRLSPKWYTIIFFTCDFISLVIQAVGGGMAATASDIQGANLGANIMLAGIVFQLAVIVTYSFCAVEYYMRYSKNSPFTLRSDKESNSDTIVRGTCTKSLKYMAYGLVFMTTCLFIRAIYRTIELSNGWNGRIISTQVYFNVLDGAMIVLAIVTMNLTHPGRLLGGSSNDNKITTD